MRQIGRYQIRNELGRGGMAIVYRAHDPRFEREVAIKLLPRQFTHDPEFLGRFQSEARIIAALEHPAIVPVYDFGEHEDAPYLVMRFMSGGSLQDRLKGRPLPIAEISTIYDRLASALDKAHKRGIIHRDIKPDNVFFDEDDLSFLGDFGIARMAEATHTMTVIGTPAYMSPEQVQGEVKIDWRCDIYALGVMLYQLLTGWQPYQSETATGQMMMHVLKPLPDVLEANPDLPPETQNIINKAMAKERAFRYPTAGAMAEDLRRLLPGSGGNADAAAALALASAATMIETPQMAAAVEPPQMATVIEPASYQPPAGATTVDSSPPLDQTAASAALSQPVAPPREAKGGSGKTFAIIGLVVILLLAALGAGYYFVFGDGSGGSEPAVASSMANLQNVPAAAPAASPTASPMPTALPSDTPVPVPAAGETDSQESDDDGDGLVGADDECPDEPGTLETGGCPATPTPPPPSETATSGPEEEQVFDFDLPAEVSALLSEATVTYHDDFTELSPVIWREAVDYQAVDGLLELTDNKECLGRLEGLAANSGMLVHFSYDDVPDSDFEMFFNNGVLGSVNYRQWGTRMNSETPAIQVVRKRSLIEDSPLDGNLTLDPDTWYQLLLAVDQDAEFVAYIWSSDDPASFSEYRQTLEDWAGQEWHGAFCNAQGDVFVESYTEIAFDEILPLVVAGGPQPAGTTSPADGAPSSSSSNQTGAASQGGGLPMGFENFGTWRRGSEDNGSFTQSSEQAHSGGSSAKLSYDFPSTDNDYVVFLQLNEMAGSPDTLAAWVYGDGVGHYLNAWIVDDDGQTWQVPLGNVTHSGWKQMSGSIDTDQEWPWTHISGPDNGKVDYPLTFRAFVLDDYSASYSGSGEIFIDDLSTATLGGVSSGSSSASNTPVGTAVAGGTPGAGGTAAAEGSPAASSGPLEFSYVIEWRLDSDDESRAFALVSVYAQGGDGNYAYFQDEELRSSSQFEFEWRACKPYPGSLRVDSGDGQTARKEVWSKAPCPDE